MPSTASPFHSSSMSGAQTTVLTNAAARSSAAAATARWTSVLTSPENPVAATAPQKNAIARHHHGSGS